MHHFPMLRRSLICLTAASALAISGSASDDRQSKSESLPPEIEAALGRITADSLRGHLSFLASDLLEGRDTPSHGLDVAAEYIAAQFRRAGLVPIGDDGFFQTASWRFAEANAQDFEATLQVGSEDFKIPVGRISLRSASGALDIRRAPVVKLGPAVLKGQELPAPEKIKGKVVLLAPPAAQGPDRAKRARAMAPFFELQRKLTSLQAALLLAVDKTSDRGAGVGRGRLLGPKDGAEDRRMRPPASSDLVPLLTVHDPETIRRLDSLPDGPAPVCFSLHLPAPVERTVKLRNVIGLLRGSDPKLRETYLLVTAHYDHVGISPSAQGDRIYNGANDDGSGTVSVIELASALGSLKPRPRRSVIFMTVFGEEHGLLGSRYYTTHPVVPLEQTVADVNIEQVGRTDSNEGPQVSSASITGFDYSTLGTTFQSAGAQVGIRVSRHARFSDPYFRASDNLSFADRGIPAHTICVAYQYPDYHGLGDHWDKVDFANMARVDRMVALAVLKIANDPVPPKWNEANPKAARYAKAARK